MDEEIIVRKSKKIKMYTVVGEAYDVTVYGTLKSVSQSLAAENMCLENQDFNEGEMNVASASDIVSALRKNWSVCLYPQGGGDWHLKVEKHTRVC